MLRELHVRSLGIVDDLTILVGPGLTAITGETGAGKTLLVEAVDLLLGGRADSSLVRAGDDEARVEGRFELADGRDVVLVRVVPQDGRSRAYIDGRLVTVGELAEVGATLVDLHGQHAHQSLFVAMAQRQALDAAAGSTAVDALAALRAARDHERQLAREIDSFGGDERARAREMDLLAFQIGEIEAARLDDPDEDLALEAQEELLADATAHREAASRAFGALEGPALDAIGAAAAELGTRTPFAPHSERLRNIQSDLADLERELRLAVDDIAEDPIRLDTVRARRQLLRELRRKYGDTLSEVMTFAQDGRSRLEALERVEARAAEIDAEREQAALATRHAAAALGGIRREAAGPLADAVSGHLRELAMPAARFEVEVSEGPLTDDGADEVSFLLSANPGEPPRPLAKAASGGELARAMLALRLVLSNAPPSLVFDEVDAGIGGEAGSSVGRLLQSLGSRHQVLCVTHLAQVAAFADAQIVVQKGEAQDRTIARAAAVDGIERVAELSRMLAGVGDSEHARRHASELLERAGAGKG